MTHDQLQIAISASFRAFQALRPAEQEAVLAVADFYRKTHPRLTRDWSSLILADQLIREDAARRSSK